jgi:hypothetical protein
MAVTLKITVWLPQEGSMRFLRNVGSDFPECSATHLEIQKFTEAYSFILIPFTIYVILCNFTVR